MNGFEASTFDDIADRFLNVLKTVFTSSVVR